MKGKIKKTLGQQEIEDLLKQFSKKYGIFERIQVSKFSHKKGFKFYIVLPKSVISGWSVAPGGGIQYPTFLVDVINKIAEPYKWSIVVQYMSAEDDPMCVHAWCEVSKTTGDIIAEEEIKVVVKEAGEILGKVKKATVKMKRETEKTRKKVEKIRNEKIRKFISDL